MKMIFVDAENIGLKELGKLEASVIDKVFVFSKADPIIQFCEKHLYLSLSDYPCGSNQADFYIIAYLARILAALDKKQLGSIRFKLYSNDENLIAAFEFQCAQLGGTSDVVRTKEDTVVQLAPKSLSPEDKIYSYLQSPKAFDLKFQKQIGLSKSDFTRAVNELAKTNKIQRSPESNKKWVKC